MTKKTADSDSRRVLGWFRYIRHDAPPDVLLEAQSVWRGNLIALRHDPHDGYGIASRLSPKPGLRCDGPTQH